MIRLGLKPSFNAGNLDCLCPKKRLNCLCPRRKIYKLINLFPGLHFREIQRKIGIATGTLQYHINFLKENELIDYERDGKFLRFYPVGLEGINKEVLGITRQKIPRAIIFYLLNHGWARNTELSNHLKLSPSTMSWYLKRLESYGIVKSNGCKYTLDGRKEIIETLLTFRESFLDKVVDRYLDMWEI
ncbi:MAG: winged helix-turn-helix transcriptional regulator [Candidatus Geothermarchaeales archaeon]